MASSLISSREMGVDGETLAINHKLTLLKMEENSRKKALAEKWSLTRRKWTPCGVDQLFADDTIIFCEAKKEYLTSLS